eukprot:COSAG02_NODE_17686_length_987_cov_1.576577_2_plen_57_part_01
MCMSYVDLPVSRTILKTRFPATVLPPRKAIVPAPAKKTLSSSQQYISPMEPNPGDKE